MGSNLIAAFGIFDVVGANLNDPAVLIELEMMGRFLMRESHFVVPAHVQRGVRILLGEDRRQGQEQAARKCSFHAVVGRMNGELVTCCSGSGGRVGGAISLRRLFPVEIRAGQNRDHRLRESQQR